MIDPGSRAEHFCAL